MAVIDLTEANFDQVIQNNSLVVVDFWAKWCGPCLAFDSVFRAVSEDYKDVIFAKVDIEQAKQLAEDFDVRSVPLLMIFRGEFAVFMESGTQTANSLKNLINQAQKINLEDLRKNLNGNSTDE